MGLDELLGLAARGRRERSALAAAGRRSCASPGSSLPRTTNVEPAIADRSRAISCRRG